MHVMKRRLAHCLAAVAAMTMAVPSVADAAQSVVSGTSKCTVTSVSPTLSKTTLTARVTVLCTVSTSVTVELGAVEIDSATATFQQVIAQTKKSVSVKANTSVAVTVSGACLNSETGNEEFATKARVAFGTSTSWSLYDQTVPNNDSFLC